MGKISPPSIKYIIHCKFTAEGVVEKPDVIGAIFGQTEGLLGEEMDLRELQKKGKIGRIDATCEVSESKTSGIIDIPTSMDKTETTIIAAAVETIDRIGPCLAKFEVAEIEDVRGAKREYVFERAKKLLEKLNENVPEIKEIQQDILTKSRTEKIREYGEEKLPAGPDIEMSPEIIVVEGRADVVNLLGYGIKNVIAMNGTSLPKTIKELSKEKEVTLFVDGDRGGLLMIKDALSSAKIAYIAQAPDGKEVEELTEKEILVCLRNKIPAEEFSKSIKPRRSLERVPVKEKEYKRKYTKEKYAEEPEEEIIDETDDERNFFQSILNGLEGSKGAAFIVKTSDGLKVLYNASHSEISRVLNSFQKKKKRIYAIILDGAATLNIIKAAEKLHCHFIVARNFANIKTRIKMISL